jgi:hypothetical protein
MGMMEKFTLNRIIINNIFTCPRKNLLSLLQIPSENNVEGFSRREKKAKNSDALRSVFPSDVLRGLRQSCRLGAYVGSRKKCQSIAVGSRRVFGPMSPPRRGKIHRAKASFGLYPRDSAKEGGPQGSAFVNAGKADFWQEASLRAFFLY